MNDCHGVTCGVMMRAHLLKALDKPFRLSEHDVTPHARIAHLWIVLVDEQNVVRNIEPP